MKVVPSYIASQTEKESSEIEKEATLTFIPAKSNSDNDLLSRVKRTRLGRFYIEHLKQYPAIHAAAIWVWRNFYLIFLRYLTVYCFADWKKLIRLSEYIRIHPGNTHTLIESARISAPIHHVVPIEDRSLLEHYSKQLIFPKIQIAVIQDAVQYGGTNFVLVGDEVIHHDQYDFTHDFTSEELHGRALIDPNHNRIKWLQFDEAPHEVPSAACFVDSCATNYAHWLSEVLPRITLFCMDERFLSIPIVVNDGLHKNIMASLFLVAHGREVITLPIGRALKINQLYVTSVTGYVPFERRNRALPDHSHGLFSPEALARLGRYLNGKVRDIRGHLWPEKIFLRRNSGTRKISNVDEIEQLAVSYGFTVVEPEKLSFPEQILLFRNARMIIGPTGAAFANGIFCNPETEVTILMSKHEDMIYRYWRNMLAPLGIKVNYILGKIVTNSHLGLHGDFEIALKDLASLLKATGNTFRQPPNIHPTAQVAFGARLGEGVEIGPYTIVHSNVILGNHTKVGAYCELGVPTLLGDGSPLTIGNNSHIRSHSVFYESSSFGTGLVTGHHVTVRENTVAGVSFQIGTLSEIQGDCSIGNYVRFQSNVFVGKKTTIGNFVWVLPYVVLTNDPTPPSDHLVGCTIEDFASIAATAVILPGVRVGRHALVAAQACVTKNVPPHKVAAGTPARVIKETKEILLRDGSGRSAYPWTQHFTRGYPETFTVEWADNKEDSK
jgi:acetyltransferase-like isoleucine patch superfamily enzyme/capsular polysaccharide biosynthesis protein